MNRTRGTVLWVTVNLLSAACYLYFASWVWPEPELRGTEYAISPGDPFVWALSALPTFVLCMVINAVLLIAWRIDRRRADGWRPSALAWLIPLLWLAACAIDRAQR
ncbi:MAG: hypothetical protein ACR2KM_07110 [Gemmatimonadaceae bacterium]